MGGNLRGEELYDTIHVYGVLDDRWHGSWVIGPRCDASRRTSKLRFRLDNPAVLTITIGNL